MIPIEKTIKKYGGILNLINRKNDVAMYVRVEGTKTTYEVVVIQKKKESEVFGKVYEARESLPVSSQWGNLGWTYVSEDRAKDKFADLQNREVSRPVTSVRPLRVRKIKK